MACDPYVDNTNDPRDIVVFVEVILGHVLSQISAQSVFKYKLNHDFDGKIFRHFGGPPFGIQATLLCVDTPSLKNTVYKNMRTTLPVMYATTIKF